MKNGPSRPFFVLLCLHISVFYLNKINWVSGKDAVSALASFLQPAAFCGLALLLLYHVFHWKHHGKGKIWFLLPALGLFFLPLCVGTRLEKNWYFALGDLFFCLMAYGKRFRKIMGCYLGAAVSCLAVAALGLVFGYTAERPKIDGVTGLSFGTVYPNTWGQIAFLALMILWYLYLRKKKLISILLFWGAAAFMYFLPECRTIALLAAVFPIAALLIKAEAILPSNRPVDRKTAIKAGFAAAVPFLCFGLTMALCWQMEAVHKWTWGTGFYSMAMRFTQGGIAFRHYGFPFIGHTLGQEDVVMVINGVKEMLYVVDSAYVTYGLFRGALWMAVILCLLAYANGRGVVRRDTGVTLIGIFMLIFAIMERPGLDGSFNFVLLYPLASLAVE